MAIRHTPLVLMIAAFWAASAAPAAAAEPIDSAGPVLPRTATPAGRDCFDWIGRAERAPRTRTKAHDCLPR